MAIKKALKTIRRAAKSAWGVSPKQRKNIMSFYKKTRRGKVPGYEGVRLSRRLARELAREGVRKGLRGKRLNLAATGAVAGAFLGVNVYNINRIVKNRRNARRRPRGMRR